MYKSVHLAWKTQMFVQVKIFDYNHVTQLCIPCCCCKNRKCKKLQQRIWNNYFAFSHWPSKNAVIDVSCIIVTFWMNLIFALKSKFHVSRHFGPFCLFYSYIRPRLFMIPRFMIESLTGFIKKYFDRFESKFPRHIFVPIYWLL